MTALLLAGAAVAPRAGAQDDSTQKNPAKDYPKKVRLKKALPKMERASLYELPRGATAAEKPVAYAAKLGDKKMLFFDVDGNGLCGDVGIDAWVIDSKVYRYVVPIESSIMLDEWEVFLHFSADGAWVHYRPEYPTFPDVNFGSTKGGRLKTKEVKKSLRIGLQNWNRLRLRTGLPPVRLDLELSEGCMAHSRYMDVHGVTHTEIEGVELYTEAGAKAGRHGSVGPAPLSLEIQFCHSSFYHRLMLFHPHTRRVGLGEGKRRATLDGTNGREKRPWTWPVIVPAPGVHDVPRRMSHERPVPHPEIFGSGRSITSAGFPITLTFETSKITDVTAELRIGGPEGAEVPFKLSWPEKPANAEKPTNFKSICLLPLEHLKPRMTYWATVAYSYRRKADERTFRFRTGK